jgi:hypothetical protein
MFERGRHNRNVIRPAQLPLAKTPHDTAFNQADIMEHMPVKVRFH